MRDLSKVRFGLLHLFEAARPELSERQFLLDNVELAQHAEKIGLDSVWLAEHHFSDYGVMPSIPAYACYIAAQTKRIRIGSAVVILPFMNPVRCAEEFAFVDVMSNGRLDFGVGRGYQIHEFRGYGVPMENSHDRYNESREIIRAAWTNDVLNYEGKVYQFKDLKIRPRPIQQPHPPFFGASFNPDTIKYQGLQKNNLLYTPLLATPDKLTEYRDALTSVGENPDNYRIGGIAFTYVAKSKKAALKEFEKPCMWYFRAIANVIPKGEYPTSEGYYINLAAMYDTFIKAYDSGQMSFADLVDNGPFSRAFLVGDPDEVGEKLDRMLNMYAHQTDVLMWTRLGGLDKKLCKKSMTLFAKDVLGKHRNGPVA